MRDLTELLRGVPIDRQNLVYEKLVTMDEAQQERFIEQLAQAIASSPGSQGYADKRATAREVREAAAPKVGELAPDFDLGRLGAAGRVTLSSHRGRPVGLIFGSYT